jgi:probable rRNA maturation factor
VKLAPPRPIEVRSLHPRLRWDRPAVVGALRLLDAHSPALASGRSRLGRDRELSVVFLTDEKLSRLHAEYLDDPAPTDVITFPGQRALHTAGEICVSADAARRQAPNGDFSAELTLYVVHGWLHLAGHDDRTAAARRSMRRAEARAMDILRAGAALPRFRLLVRPSAG